MKRYFLILLMFVGLAVSPFVTATASEGEVGKVDPKEIIFEHLSDRYGWEVPFCHSQSIPLPIIVRDYTGSWHLFSSERLMHGAEYEGFRIATEGPNAKHIVSMRPAADGSMEEYAPLDLSVTKNVAGLFISALVVVLLCLKARRWYCKNGFKAPRKLTGIVEVVVEFVYFGVIRSILGPKARRFAPYLLTVFFFILIMNLLGLIVIFPGGANLTGNVAVTLVLALFTFGFTNLLGTKHYWKDIFWPDVPIWLKCPLPIMQTIEVFGIFTKPAALTVRLFANMMGGHMIVITLTLLIFIFAAFGAAFTGVSVVVSVAFSLFMLLLDVLVSFIQAYVFTMLSTIFIALAQEGGHEEHAEAAAEPAK